MKKNSELTPTQEIKRLNRAKWGCLGGEFLSVIAPFVTIAFVNYDKYFVEYNGTKMSVALILGMALMGFAIWGITQKKLENTFVSFIVKWCIVALIFTFLGSIINDIAIIMWFGLIGLCVAQGLEIGREKINAKQEMIKSAKEEAIKDTYKEKAKEENNKKSVF